MRHSRFSVLKGRKVGVFQHTCFKETKNFEAKMVKWPHHGRKNFSNHVAAALANMAANMVENLGMAASWSQEF